MAIRTNTELLEAIRERLGDDHTDEALALLEDIKDTMDNKDVLSAEGSLWKTKYEENDTAWRKKYHDRFFAPADNADDEDFTPKKGQDGEGAEVLTFEKLFKEGV